MDIKIGQIWSVKKWLDEDLEVLIVEVLDEFAVWIVSICRIKEMFGFYDVEISDSGDFAECWNLQTLAIADLETLHEEVSEEVLNKVKQEQKKEDCDIGEESSNLFDFRAFEMDKAGYAAMKSIFTHLVSPEPRNKKEKRFLNQ